MRRGCGEVYPVGLGPPDERRLWRGRQERQAERELAREGAYCGATKVVCGPALGVREEDVYGGGLEGATSLDKRELAGNRSHKVLLMERRGPATPVGRKKGRGAKLR